ncbi:hypothetical protein BJX70DRAFT_362071 [Aspergillus crustosus]
MGIFRKVHHCATLDSRLRCNPLKASIIIPPFGSIFMVSMLYCLTMLHELAFRLAPRAMPSRLSVRPPDFHRRMLGWSHSTIHSQRRSPVRNWASSATEPTIDRLLACTWLTTTPEQLTPDDVLSNCPLTASNLSSNYTPILLFTPAFAQWADTRSAFFQRWMNQFFKKTSNNVSPVHTVVAIIDRLPYNHARGSSDAPTESEGVSILLTRSEDILGKAVAPRQPRSVGAREPTLLFSFQDGVKNIGGTHGLIHEIGLRLANTVFLNGKENTLVGARWSPDPSTAGLRLDESIDLSACSVAINTVNIANSLDIPLHPVGERRKVISSMGNILRQISKHTDGRLDEPMPASAELEKELPRYIAEHGIADQRVTVWALTETSAESPYNKSTHSRSSLAKAIEMGAKLHRVMSGGGGWGKKQGLLSLDPEMSFGQDDNGSLQPLHRLMLPNAADSVDEAEIPLEEPVSIQDLSTLSQVVEPGDFVQFLVSVEEQQPHTNRGFISSEETVLCDFGVLSNADTLLSQTTQQKDITIVSQYFGALSEKAVTYLQPSTQPHSRVSETITKIDVPGSRVLLKVV